MVVRVYRGYGIFIKVFGTGKFIFWPAWPWRAARFIRGLFPTFYAVGMHCCDHGGQVRSWRPEWALNEWHFMHVSQHDWGDGCDSWQPVRVDRWLHWRFKLWRAGKYSEHVDEPL